MNRTNKLYEYINGELLTSANIKKRGDAYLRGAYLHLYGVSNMAAMIAMKRGENIELAMIAGLLHDFYGYTSVYDENHARNGAVLAKEILEHLNITSDEETQVICAAIHNHGDKDITGDAFDEVIKDADVMHHCFYNITSQVKPHEAERFAKLKIEFGLGIS